MKINTNVASLTALEANTSTNKILSGSLEKLSTGLQINKASDDASGLNIADKLRTQASSLAQSVKNGNSAVSLTQIADKAMDEISNIIDVMKQKTLQSVTGTTSSAGQLAIQADVAALIEQIDSINTQTNYNGIQLLDGTETGLQFQMGETATDVVSLVIDAVGSSDLGIDGVTGVSADISLLDLALSTLNAQRGYVGSIQNQLESSTRNMSTAVTNIQAAESVIRDVDYAAESANFNKLNIISQAGTYAISQANNVQQNVMRLLQ